MAQKKLKAKAQLPNNMKKSKAPKGVAVTKRANRPTQPKKKGSEEGRKLKKILTKTVNKAVEDEIRNRAGHEAQRTLSAAQKAVASHNLGTKSAPGPS